MSYEYSEAILIEQTAIDFFNQLGWGTLVDYN